MADRTLGEEMAAAELRGQVEAELAAELEAAGERDRAYRALVMSVTMAVLVMLPLVALVLGASVRLFGWASGLY